MDFHSVSVSETSQSDIVMVGMVSDIVADMELDMVADMEVDNVADMVADNNKKK